MVLVEAPSERERSRRMRADASRNRERLVAAATAVFGEQGADVALEEVARNANLSIATLYRHFPSREALLEEALHDQLQALSARSRMLLSSPSPGAALCEWLRAMVDQAVAYRGLPGPLRTILENEPSRASAACTSLNAHGAHLLARAQAADAVRADIEYRDLVDLITGIAWTVDQKDDPRRRQRLLQVLMAGLRP